MRSIRTRLTIYFIFIIVITVITLEVIIINLVRENYYKNLEGSLHSQVKVACGLYERYFSDASLYDNVLNNVDTFWKQSTAQVQILDLEGRVLMDSIGYMPSENIVTRDVKEALEGNAGTWMGKVDYDRSMVMAVACPLKTGDKIVGVLRYVSSLREVNDDVMDISRVFILVGAFVVAISALISLLLSNTIVTPLKIITRVAGRMASGNYTVKCPEGLEDETGKLSRTLNYMAQEILTRERLKNEFISSVSHELRTPLTSIKGWAVTLKECGPGDRETLLDGLNIIEKESDRLTSMLEELLDFSRFVTGKISFNKEQTDINELVNHIYKQMAPRAGRENIQFEMCCPEQLPEVMTDANRLKQVFINILDNSFRFTPAGGKVAFECEAGDKKLIFRIKDTGCGIPFDELPRVKEKFFKGRTSKSRNGIGLSICDEIVKLMGGALEIESEVGRGTTVTIAIPF